MRDSPVRPRRGIILPLIAVLLVALIGFVGLAIDVGYVVATRAQLQNAADAAAMAGASQLLDRDELTGSPDQLAEIAAGSALAQKFGPANTAGGVAVQVLSTDLLAGYLASPTTTLTAPLPNLVPAPVAFSPPLLFVPSVVGPTIPFITPPATTSAYRSANSMRASARRDSLANGPVVPFFSGVNGYRSAAIGATSTATYEDNIIGFQVLPTGPATSRLLPFALDVNTFASIAAGLSSLDLYKYNPSLPVPPYTYANRLSFGDPTLGSLLGNVGSALSILLNPTAIGFSPQNLLFAPLTPALQALIPGDGIKEALLVPLLIPQSPGGPLNGFLPIGPLTVGNFGTLYLGNTKGNLAAFRRQVQYGVNAADFASLGGSLQLGADGTVAVLGNTGLDATLKSILVQVKGQPRVIPLYRAAVGSPLVSTALGVADTTYTIVGFGGVVIVDVLEVLPLNGLGLPISLTPIGLNLVIQPEFVIDPTAIGGGASLANGGATTSRFVYRPLALTR